MDESAAGADVGAVTSLEAMRSTGIATSHTGTMVKKTKEVAGTTVTHHARKQETSTKKIGAHTVNHSKRK